jgi:hypothetical protein
MGDGSLFDTSGQSYLRVKMISNNYLEWLDNFFGILTTGVVKKLSAEENAKQNRDSGFSPNADARDYSDVYELRSRSHPKLTELSKRWHKGGKKVWPSNVEITPELLRHWYVCDGYFDDKSSHRRIVISMSNESENTDKITQMFSNSNLPTPSNYKFGTTEYYGEQRTKCDAVWTRRDSELLWQYMRGPLPDFEYKWPVEYR